MARPEGSRNAGYAQERERLAEGVMRRLMEPGGPQASFRALANACGVSPATLRHYFADRDGALQAALELAHQMGEPHMRVVRDGEMGTVQLALEALLRLLMVGWRRFGVMQIHRAGLTVGLGDASLGPVYVTELLEPVLQAFEARMRLHIESGELMDGDPRVMALALVSPVLMGLIHQDALMGAECRPLDVDALIEVHVGAFLRAYGVDVSAQSANVDGVGEAA